MTYQIVIVVAAVLLAVVAAVSAGIAVIVDAWSRRRLDAERERIFALWGRH